MLQIAGAVDVAVQAGGGVRAPADAAALLDHGVDRVVLGTAALETPELVESLAGRYPGRVAVGLDHRGAGAELAVRGWEQSSGTTLGAALGRLAPVELGAVVVTAIDRDGMLGGPDLVGLRSRARADGPSRGGVGRGAVAVGPVRAGRAAWRWPRRGERAGWPVPSSGPRWSKGP